MSTVLEPPETEAPPDVNGGNNVLDPGPPGGGGDGDDPWGGRGFPLRYDPYRVAVWFFLVPVIAFFVALTRAMVVSRHTSPNWAAVAIPGLLYANTAVLVGSSVTLEFGLIAMRRAARTATVWLWVTTSLGVVFLASQVHVWMELKANGIARTSSTATAFFYALTMSHGAHLLGALCALAYLTIRQTRSEFTARRQSALNAAALFWHCMAGLWIYVLALLAL